MVLFLSGIGVDDIFMSGIATYRHYHLYSVRSNETRYSVYAAADAVTISMGTVAALIPVIQKAPNVYAYCRYGSKPLIVQHRAVQDLLRQFFKLNTIWHITD